MIIPAGEACGAREAPRGDQQRAREGDQAVGQPNQEGAEDVDKGALVIVLRMYSGAFPPFALYRRLAAH